MRRIATPSKCLRLQMKVNLLKLDIGVIEIYQFTACFGQKI